VANFPAASIDEFLKGSSPMNLDTLLAYVLLDIALVLLLGRLFGVALSRFGQPLVMAEIFAGIALGPSLFGALAPHASEKLFAPEVTQMLSAIGTLGLVLFMFLVGLELDYGTARRQRRTVSWITLGSLLVPLAAGIALGIYLYPANETVAGHHVPMVAFVLFVCVALSVTAFPVLARILIDHGLDGTRLGVVAMSVAAFHDLTGWLLLALALTAAAGEAPISALWKVGVVLALVATLLWAVRPLLRRTLGGDDLTASGGTQLVVVLCVIAAGAGITQAIDLHAVIGGFIVGLTFPRDLRPQMVTALRQALLPVTMSLLLPIYFIGPGLSFDLASLGASGVGGILLIVGVSCGAKLLGTAAGARFGGLNWRDAGVIGFLINTRGLVELIILNIGFTEGVLNQTLYSEFVVMALVATLMTSPILRFSMRHARGELWQPARAERTISVSAPAAQL
jgi:Kef-type K+ transport system membrane component KefB